MSEQINDIREINHYQDWEIWKYSLILYLNNINVYKEDLLPPNLDDVLKQWYVLRRKLQNADIDVDQESVLIKGRELYEQISLDANISEEIISKAFSFVTEATRNLE